MNSDISKRELRALMRKAQRAHSLDECAAASEKACAAVLDMERYARAKTLLLYMAMPTEIDPSIIAEAALASGKRVAYPRCIEGNLLELYMGDVAAFEKNSYGILEPVPGRAQRIAAGEIDMAIVPGMAFDREKARLGHGAGYYDRLFDKLRPDAFKLGFAFSWQIADKVPTEPHDISMDSVATDEGII